LYGTAEVKKDYGSLDDLLNDCTVRIKIDGEYGTGFFVAPGLVLTCTHVIDAAYQKGTSIFVYYTEKELSPFPIGEDEFFPAPYPDMALLRVNYEDHPCVLLGREYRAFIDFYSFGYTQDHPDGESTTVECEGILVDGGTLIKLKEGQVKPGSSGSPLLNKKTGSVCGLINRTRGRGTDLGGTAIPISTVFSKFPDLERQNLAFHRQDLRWKDLLEKEETVKTSSAALALLLCEPGKITKPPYWVGREELLNKVDQLLDQSHRVLLTGMGGIGKTSLAQMLVEERLQAGRKPVLWLEVKDEKSDLLMEALAKACGDDQITSISNRDAKKLALKELLAKSDKGLLVLDNIRNLEALDDLLDAVPDELPVLMTSRMSFDTSEIIDVEQLSPAEALDLLEKASGAANFSGDESARMLCKLLGYHPLALEIAGASMKERRISPKALLRRLEANPVKLSSLRRGEIRPLLDDYVADLQEPLQSTFFAFGKFPVNRLTPAFLATYLGRSWDDVLEALDNLVVRNLVKTVPEVDVYYLHDLIFHYLQTISRMNEQDKSYLIQSGITYMEANRHDFDLIAFDLSNLLGIAGIAQGLDLVKLVSYLTIGNFPLQEGKSYVDQRGYSLGLIGQLDRAIEIARSDGEQIKTTLHYLLGKRGNAAFRRGDYQLAAEKYKEELLLSPNEERQVMIGSILARTLAFSGQIEESHKQFEIASQLAGKLDEDELHEFVLEQESWAAGYLKDYVTALRVAEKQLVMAQRLFERSGEQDYEPLTIALLNYGSAKLELAKQGQGSTDGVLSSYERMKNLAEKHGDDRHRAHAHKSLGELYHYLGDRIQAQSNFTQALEIWQVLEMTQEEKDLWDLLQELGYLASNSMEEKDEHKN
jgi:tetratricopeptide (TPR) repeat protein